MVFQYRRAFYIMIVIHFALFLVYLSLFKSIYAYNNVQEIKGYSLQQMVWYFTSTALVGSFVITFIDGRISYKILNGDLSINLLKPVSLFKTELGCDIGFKIP